MLRRLSLIGFILACVACSGTNTKKANQLNTDTDANANGNDAGADVTSALERCRAGGHVCAALHVSAKANIFGSGHASPPGDGELPAEVSLSALGATAGQSIVVTDVLGSLDWGAESLGPDGGSAYATQITSVGGISGITSDRCLFLIGVFAAAGEPQDPAPDVLDFTGNRDFSQLDPKLDQTFWIGDGLAGATQQKFVIPDGTTRLFLGFADALGFHGSPGSYNDNTGELTAIVRAQ